MLPHRQRHPSGRRKAPATVLQLVERGREHRREFAQLKPGLSPPLDAAAHGDRDEVFVAGRARLPAAVARALDLDRVRQHARRAVAVVHHEALQAAALKYAPEDMQVSTKEIQDGLDNEEPQEDCLQIQDVDVQAVFVPSAAKVDRQQSARVSRLRGAPWLKKIQSIF